jgi:hypothetical protein
MAADAVPVDEEAQAADRLLAVLAPPRRVRDRDVDPHLVPAEPNADGAVAARAAFGFLERHLAVVGVLGGKQEGASLVAYVGNLTHRDLLTIWAGDVPSQRPASNAFSMLRFYYGSPLSRMIVRCKGHLRKK